MTAHTAATRVICPTCGTQVIWSAEESPWRPFCSERCRLLDLGAWFTEERAIAGESEPVTDQAGPNGDDAE